MRGEVCVTFASVLSAISLLLLIFVHVSQINTSTVPRSLYLAQVNMTGYGAAISASIFNPVQGLYTNDSTAPLQAAAGLRQIYKFGFYSYCAFVDEKAGLCGNQTIGHKFQPYETVTADMASNYSVISRSFIPEDTTFRSAKYLGESSKAAYWLMLLGTITTGLALITGIAKNHLTFFLSTIFSIISSIFLLTSASLWTVMISKTEAINTATNIANDMPLDIFVSRGPTLFVLWASFVIMVLSVVPYTIICCTYRG